MTIWSLKEEEREWREREGKGLLPRRQRSAELWADTRGVLRHAKVTVQLQRSSSRLWEPRQILSGRGGVK